MPKKRITVDFDEIFHYAKEGFDVQWNKCCDIFHGSSEILTSPESKNKTIYKQDTEANLKWNEENPESKYLNTEDDELAYKILISFMEKHKLEEMYVIND